MRNNLTAALPDKTKATQNDIVASSNRSQSTADPRARRLIRIYSFTTICFSHWASQVFNFTQVFRWKRQRFFVATFTTSREAHAIFVVFLRDFLAWTCSFCNKNTKQPTSTLVKTFRRSQGRARDPNDQTFLQKLCKVDGITPDSTPSSAGRESRIYGIHNKL